IFAGDQRAAHSVLFWTLGGLGLANWDVLPIAATGLIVLGAVALTAHRPLDALLAGDDAAATLGINVARFRQLTFLACAFATASFVALSGVIGFIGLMVPHIARGLVGPLHGSLLITSAVIGAGLLLASDIAARTLLAPQELPIGVLTTSFGALFVLFLVRWAR
ncbi:MAG: iron chelate uptake ABC transporter family permease subunit, partial [Pseudomonadota bacterium]